MDSEFQAGPSRPSPPTGARRPPPLAVSIVCLTFSVNWLWTETHYDSFRPGYKDLYVVEREDSLEHTESLLYRWGDRVSSVLGKEAMVGSTVTKEGGNVFTCRIVPKRFFMRKSCLHLRNGSLVGMPCSFRFARRSGGCG